MDRAGPQRPSRSVALALPLRVGSPDAPLSPLLAISGVRMQLRSPLFALLAAVVFVTSLPAVPTHAAEPRTASVAPLPGVETDDGRFGFVQGMVQPDLAWQAGARWDRIIFPWSLIQRDGPTSWTQLYFTDEAIRAQARRGVTI